MEQQAVDILNHHRLMAAATLRADGWPQSTMVSYTNKGLLLYSHRLPRKLEVR